MDKPRTNNKGKLRVLLPHKARVCLHFATAAPMVPIDWLLSLLQKILNLAFLSFFAFCYWLMKHKSMDPVFALCASWARQKLPTRSKMPFSGNMCKFPCMVEKYWPVWVGCGGVHTF